MAIICMYRLYAEANEREDCPILAQLHYNSIGKRKLPKMINEGAQSTRRNTMLWMFPLYDKEGHYMGGIVMVLEETKGSCKKIRSGYQRDTVTRRAMARNESGRPR